MEMTLCELFAGVGGFRLGLEKSSDKWKTVWFSQWEPGRKVQWAHDCYTAHWNEVSDNTGIDISLVDKRGIPNHNLLVGGFPCQDYSVAKPLTSSEGIHGKKGVLWWQIRDVIEAKQPPFILLENVDRLLKSPASQRGRDFGIMLYCLMNLGYAVEWRVINAADYGAAQRRRRIFIFAYSEKTNYFKKSAEKNPVEIIGKNGFFPHIFPVDILTTTTQFDINLDEDLHVISDTFELNFENSGYCYDGKIFTANTIPIKEKPIKLKEILEDNVPEKYFLGEDISKWAYLKGSKKIERISANGHSYTFSEGAISFPDSLDTPSRTLLTSESSLSRSTHIIRDPDNGRLRKLTPKETERLQGFNDDWTNTGMPEKFRYFCMGNALVVPMITRMGIYISKIFEKER